MGVRVQAVHQHFMVKGVLRVVRVQLGVGGNADARVGHDGSPVAVLRRLVHEVQAHLGHVRSFLTVDRVVGLEAELAPFLSNMPLSGGISSGSEPGT